MDSLRDQVNDRSDEIAAWMALGLDIDMLGPSSEAPRYRALLPEFELVGEGETEDEAINALHIARWSGSGNSVSSRI